MVRITHLQRLVFETFICLGIIFIAMFIFVSFYSQLADTARCELLKAELQNLRIVLEVYKVKKGTYPDDLEELVEWNDASKYFIFLKLDDEGHPLDPFGNRFIYDKENGTVKAKVK